MVKGLGKMDSLNFLNSANANHMLPFLNYAIYHLRIFLLFIAFISFKSRSTIAPCSLYVFLPTLSAAWLTPVAPSPAGCLGRDVPPKCSYLLEKSKHLCFMWSSKSTVSSELRV